jgi:hypothetical protein
MRRVKQFVVAVVAVAAGSALAPVAQADPLPEGCDKEQSVITCGPTPVINPAGNEVQGQKETTTTKGSFESSHPEVTCVEPGQSGKCR